MFGQLSYFTKGNPSLIFLIGLLMVGSVESARGAEDGQAIFQQKCATCHTIGGGRTVGPDLQGVTERRERSWLSRWIAEPDKMLSEGDPTAIQLTREYNYFPMPNTGLSRPEVDAVLTFIKIQSGKVAEAPPGQAPSAPRPKISPARLTQSPLLGLFASFLFVALIISLVFSYVGLSTRDPHAIDMKTAYRVRKTLFFLLLAVLAVFLVLTLPRMPYPNQGQRADRVIHMVAKQFAFAFSETPMASEQEWGKLLYGPPIEVPAGALVEFRVTSFDVNHGFGVYTPEGQLLAQTQAMPGYVNRLQVRFDRPGKFTILCLEYCGLAHHLMRGIVVAR